ncbi:Uma2 family endonuclease [Leptolyngbya sp. FACHB-36]|uniref:Uma2 family endonuclease n=1 Tax=Leptolyngbya sp. FACHB-36 TaxID=2692808 RepID=UPI00167FEB3B|nr:Uma2 family endonuclease [Leptolyngbya sp. FACHB-36]MBD2022391.1 Uma2 family endonuclease [Leptolyngbya sp. FACHB-36]
MTAFTSTADRSSIPLRQWHRATWEDYVALRDASIPKRMRLAFNQGWLWIDMGGEGINHASVSDLFTALLFIWAMQHLEQTYTSFGRCLLEKSEAQACAPDLVLYVGEEFPRWQEGEPRRIDLNQWRVPDLVGEISDTSLATDLDEQKHLYAALGIPEYWVVDVRGRRVFSFLLQDNGEYKATDRSQALDGLAIALLDQTLERLPESSNTAAAAWFAQQI